MTGGLFERIGRQVLIGQHPEWHDLRLKYRTRRMRWNTWRLMNWYRVTP